MEQDSELRSLQEKMLSLVFDPDREGQKPELGLYREMTRASLKDTFRVLFPHSRKVYQSLELESDWYDLGEEFIAIHRPKDFRLNWAFESFSDWLPIQELGIGEWFRELVDFEWCQFQATTAPDFSNPSEGSLKLNPSLILRFYSYPVPRWYQFRNETKNPVHLETLSSTYIVIYRDKNSKLRTLEVQPSALELLLEWQNGKTPVDSIQSLVQQLVTAGKKVSEKEVADFVLPLLKKLYREGILLEEYPLDGMSIEKKFWKKN